MNRDTEDGPRGRCGCGRYKVYVSKDGLLCCYCGAPPLKGGDNSKPSSNQNSSTNQGEHSFQKQKPSHSHRIGGHSERSTGMNMDEEHFNSPMAHYQALATTSSPRDIGTNRYTIFREMSDSKTLEPTIDNKILQTANADCEVSTGRFVRNKSLGNVNGDAPGSQKFNYSQNHTYGSKDKLNKYWSKNSPADQDVSLSKFKKQAGSHNKSGSDRNESRSLQNAIDKLHTQQMTRTVTESATRPNAQHTTLAKAPSRKLTGLLLSNPSSNFPKAKAAKSSNKVDLSDQKYFSKEPSFCKEEQIAFTVGQSTTTSTQKEQMDTSKDFEPKQKSPVTVSRANERQPPLTHCMAQSSYIKEVGKKDREQRTVNMTTTKLTGSRFMRLNHHEYTPQASKDMTIIPAQQFDQQTYESNYTDDKSRTTGKAIDNTLTHDGHSPSQLTKAMQKCSHSDVRKDKGDVPWENVPASTMTQKGQTLEDALPIIPFPTPVQRIDGSSVESPGQIPWLQFPFMTSFPDLTNTQEDHGQPLTKKRQSSDKGLHGVASAEKKRKITGMDVPFPTPIQTTDFEVKPCQLLVYGALPWREIYGVGPTIKGVYKIAYKGKAIYVGGDSGNVINQLRGHFKGSGQRELFNFLKSLTVEARQDVTVYWLDEKDFQHKCGQTYLKCVEYIQGQKPRFNGVPRKSLLQCTSSHDSYNFAQQDSNVSNALNFQQLAKNDNISSVNPWTAETLVNDIQVDTGSNEMQDDKDLAVHSRLTARLDTLGTQGLDTVTPMEGNSEPHNMVIDLTGNESLVSQQLPYIQDPHIHQDDHIRSQLSPFTELSKPMTNVEVNNLRKIFEQTPNMPSCLTSTQQPTKGTTSWSVQITNVPPPSGNSPTTDEISSWSTQTTNVLPLGRKSPKIEEMSSRSSEMTNVPRSNRKSLTTEEISTGSESNEKISVAPTNRNSSKTDKISSGSTTLAKVYPTSPKSLATEEISSRCTETTNVPPKSYKSPKSEEISSECNERISVPSTSGNSPTTDEIAPGLIQTTSIPPTSCKSPKTEEISTWTAQTTNYPTTSCKLQTAKAKASGSSKTTNITPTCRKILTATGNAIGSTKTKNISPTSDKLQTANEKASGSTKTANISPTSRMLQTAKGKASGSSKTTKISPTCRKILTATGNASGSTKTKNISPTSRKLQTAKGKASGSTKTTNISPTSRKLQTAKGKASGLTKTTNISPTSRKLQTAKGKASGSTKTKSIAPTSRKLQTANGKASGSTKTKSIAPTSRKIQTAKGKASGLTKTKSIAPTSRKLQTVNGKASGSTKTTNISPTSRKLQTAKGKASELTKTTNMSPTSRKLHTTEGIVSGSTRTSNIPMKSSKLEITNGIVLGSSQTKLEVKYQVGTVNKQYAVKGRDVKTRKTDRGGRGEPRTVTTQRTDINRKEGRRGMTIISGPLHRVQASHNKNRSRGNEKEIRYDEISEDEGTSRENVEHSEEEENSSEEDMYKVDMNDEDIIKTDNIGDRASSSTWSALKGTLSTGLSWIFGKK